MIIGDNRRPLKLQSASRVTGAVLTIRIDDYKIFVLTKVTSNHTNRRPSHSKCLSRLLSPLQIQLKSKRTGAVLTITINIYKTTSLKVPISTLGQDCFCPPSLLFDLWRTGESRWPFWVIVSSNVKWYDLQELLLRQVSILLVKTQPVLLLSYWICW